MKKVLFVMISLSDHFSYSKLLRFVFPSVIMMVFTSVYGVVDGLFVSNFVGKTAFASINLIMPFVMIIGGTGFMVGTGGTALVSKVLGEQDAEKANRYFSMMVLLVLGLGAVLSVLGIVFMRQVSYLLGATEEMIADCVLYGRIVIGFTVAFMLQNLFQSFFIAAERPKLGLLVTVAAGCTNMALDALFIAGFHWGVAGAAIATGISQFVGGVIPLIYFLCPNRSRLRLCRTKPQIRPMLQACANGSSELMNNISSSVVGMLYNFQLMRLAGEDGVSAYGVLMYVQFIFVAIFIGYAVGCSPIVSYHYGAHHTDELKSLLRKSVILMGIAGVILTILAKVLAHPLAALFVGYDENLFALTRYAFHIFSYSFLLAGFNIYVSAFFTALNNGGVSAAISFLRTLVFQTASVLILPLILHLDGIWWANTFAEICAFVLSVVFLFAKRKKYQYF